VLAGAAAAVVLLYRASQEVPDFYREASALNPESIDAKSDEMIDRATGLHNSVVTEGRWRSEFNADVINAWLTVDLPKNHEQSLPAGMSDPRVGIRQDELTVGCKITRGAFHGIVWIDLGISMVAPERSEANDKPAGEGKIAATARPAQIAVRIHKARLGSIPWPLDNIIRSISDAARLNEIQVDWEQDHGDPVALITMPTKMLRHGQHVRLDTIHLEPGKIVVAGTTERDKL